MGIAGCGHQRCDRLVVGAFPLPEATGVWLKQNHQAYSLQNFIKTWTLYKICCSDFCWLVLA